MTVKTNHVQLQIQKNHMLSVALLDLCIYKSLAKQIFLLHESKIYLDQESFRIMKKGTTVYSKAESVTTIVLY